MPQPQGGRSRRQQRRRVLGGAAGGHVGAEPLEPRLCLAASLSISLAEPVVIEGERHVATLQLSAASPTLERVYVTTAPGSASYGTDYFAPVSQQVIFAPGQTRKTVTIPTLRDAGGNRVEGVESFQIVATSTNPAIAATSVTALVSDFVPKPSVVIGGVVGNEGNASVSQFTFSVSLTSAYVKPVEVFYTTADGTATVADGDYTATTGTLTFLPGETSKTVTVDVIGDRRLEPDETFRLRAFDPVNASVRTPSVEGVILNDEIDQPGFQITVEYLDSPQGAVPDALRQIAEQAANRWSRIITGDLEGVMDGANFVDDLVFQIQIGLLGGTPTDGPSGILANARPTDFRPDAPGLPYKAITGIDPADTNVATAAQRTQLLDTITHEFGHGLGFTLGFAGYAQYVDVDNALFTGPNAVREYNTLFDVSAAGAPLQPGGLAHWDEGVFGDELMTPSAGAGRELISSVTIGALDDMGYQVDYAAAEPYTPAISLPRLPASSGPDENAKVVSIPASAEPARPGSVSDGPIASPESLPPAAADPAERLAAIIEQAMRAGRGFFIVPNEFDPMLRDGIEEDPDAPRRLPRRFSMAEAMTLGGRGMLEALAERPAVVRDAAFVGPVRSGPVSPGPSGQTGSSGPSLDPTFFAAAGIDFAAAGASGVAAGRPMNRPPISTWRFFS